MRQKVVCFDLDDTLYKEREFQYSGFRKVAEIIEERTGMRDVFAYMCKLLQEKKNVFKTLETETQGEVRIHEMLKIYREHFPSIHLDSGAERLLDSLKKRGCILGIITDGRSVTQQNKIKALGLGRWFSDENIIISEDFGSEKPDERNFLYFEYRYPGCRYYYIGDNAEKDFIAPNHLGWDTYGIRDFFGTNIHEGSFESVEIEKRPRYVVDQLYSLIKKIVPSEGEPFIVPLMVNCADESTQVGTGVIAEGYLLTASHVFHNERHSHLQYLFDNKVFTLSIADAAFDGNKDESVENYSKDLLIFKVPHSSSPFILNTKTIDPSLRCRAKSYFFAWDKLHFDTNDRIKILSDEDRCMNCLLVETPFSFHSGNSGCPIYSDFIVYGTLWKSHRSSNNNLGECRYEIVDARYIIDVINRIR